MEPWAFRSVLDKQPRMLTLALDTACFMSYDLSRGTVYKAWKGGVLLEGTVYTDKKNVQPTSWGEAYYIDSLKQATWEIQLGGEKADVKFAYQGHFFRDNKITLKYALILNAGDTVLVTETPEFMRDESGRPGLERIFKTSGVPEGASVYLSSQNSATKMQANGVTRSLVFFDELPTQFPPDLKEQYDHLGRYWMENSDCFTCHEIDKDNAGPSFENIAEKYPNDKATLDFLAAKVKDGGSGSWGSGVMNPHPQLSDREIMTMLGYVFSLRPPDREQQSRKLPVINASERKTIKPTPGHGASLEGIHPSYNLQTLHAPDFQPRVGGLAFLPDGRLLVTTWDAIGGVYLLENMDNGDPTQMSVKKIASGLAEPLGIEVVDGEIYVLQKHELTHLVDRDGDEIIDEYRAVCNSWGVTGDFHEFAFGLVHHDGYFYATLSLAMRLMDGEQQHPDRGRTIKIDKNGNYEWLNYGLRTPNGIGLGPEDQLFVTDNQGQWLPGNKLIHVKKDSYEGMAWGLPDKLSTVPAAASPAIWLPDGEIGNSPSEPIFIHEGPYKGQMLHGDVTHGGIKRDFLEKVNGAYQGAVFRFSQGFEAGVNRLSWGPDGSLYVGGVGMVGGWSWKGKRYGLQRMEYNGQPAFEMLAVRAKPRGFEIEFTLPLSSSIELQPLNWQVQQWWYLPTESYGGPKMDLETLKIESSNISEDRKRVYLDVPGLKEAHVVYIRLPENLKSAEGKNLWSSEAWYTLNNIPKD